MEIGRWGGRTFTIASNVVRGFTGLTIKGSSETEDKTDSNQKYVSRKNGKPAEIGMTVILHGGLGVNVRSEAMSFISDAQAGTSDYMYIKNQKLVPCKLMLTDAEVSEAKINPAAEWVACQVKLTFKQSTKFDGSTSSSGSSSSKKASTKTKATAQTNAQTNKKESTTSGTGKITESTATTATSEATSGKEKITTAVNNANQTVNRAKKASADKAAAAKNTAPKTSTTTAAKKTSFTFAPAKKTTTSSKK